MLVRIENLTQKTTIMRNGEVANNPWLKLSDFVGSKQANRHDGLLAAPVQDTRYMFTSAPVDVMYVDADSRVIELDERMLPGNSAKPRYECSYIVEAPVGAIARSRTTVGDLLQVIYKGAGVQAAHDVFRQ